MALPCFHGHTNKLTHAHNCVLAKYVYNGLCNNAYSYSKNENCLIKCVFNLGFIHSLSVKDSVWVSVCVFPCVCVHICVYVWPQRIMLFLKPNRQVNCFEKDKKKIKKTKHHAPWQTSTGIISTLNPLSIHKLLSGLSDRTGGSTQTSMQQTDHQWGRHASGTRYLVMIKRAVRMLWQCVRDAHTLCLLDF